MDEPNEERMEASYDEGELSDDEFDFECLSFDSLLDRVESNDPTLTEDEFKEQSVDNMLDRVESNDPSLTKLRVRLSTLVQNNDDNRHRLDRLATAIGRNTQLKALRCDGYGEQINEARAMILFRGIACNQSIKRLHSMYCEEYSGSIRILTPLFKNNQVERIEIYRDELSLESTRLLATSLASFDSLKEFIFAHNRLLEHIPQEGSRDLIQSLSGHSGLRKLDLSNTDVGKHGCSELVDLLSNPNINLRVLHLNRNNLGDDEAVALASGMAGNISLKEINLGCNRGITQAGWQAIFDALGSPSCRMERITLGGNDINDAAAQSLSNALTSNTSSLKTLNLWRMSITPTGWRVLFWSLRSQTCALQDLDLTNNQLNGEVMDSLIDALTSNRSLKSLNLWGNTRVTGAGWQRFFSTVLANPSSELEKLGLSYCGNINDAAIRALTDALVNNSKLKVLDVMHNQVTNTGWEIFSSFLQSPNAALEELALDVNEINDATRTSLVNSLANNKKLKKLFFDHSQDWEPPMSVLCNSDNIMSTYNSNHILGTMSDDLERLPLPEEFESLLQINRENSLIQAARLKIINTHFNEGFITQPFVGMDLNVLPHAMAWMSRDGRAGEVSGHFYEFIRSISSLFENANWLLC